MAEEVAKPEEAAAGLSEVPMILADFLSKLSPKGKGVWQERWFAPGLALSQCSAVQRSVAQPLVIHR